MKIILTTLSLFLAAFLPFTNAQGDPPYEFSVLEQSYADLVDPEITTNSFWDDFDGEPYEIPVGFEFMLFDQPLTSLNLGGDFGEILYGPAYENGDLNFLIPYFVDLISRVDNSGNVLSSISHLAEGEEGHRIFKGQWKDVGFYNDDNGDDFVNFQYWFYEEDGAIEIHIGPSSITLPLDYLFDDATGPIIGLFNRLDENVESFALGLVLSGDPAKPQMQAITEFPADELPPSLSAPPAEGIVYRFVPTVINEVSNPETAMASLEIFPTVVENELFLKTERWEDKTFQVTDLAGKTVVDRAILEANVLELSHLSPGIYFIQMYENGRGIQTKKFIKS